MLRFEKLKREKRKRQTEIKREKRKRQPEINITK